jgi:TatD DNase family protein
MVIPTLDSHAHINLSYSQADLSASGAVLAMSLSLEEAERALQRTDTFIAWGVGCHPRFLRSQVGFDAYRFRSLVEQTAIVGEVGMDAGSHVPLEMQRKIFRQVLEIIAGQPRLVSIHSYQATGLVLQELQHCPITVPVLHWWTGNVAETKKAVELGCYFSIHSAVARHSKFRLHVPLDRVLVESDHGYNDPPAAIPSRIEWVEYLAAQQYHLGVKEFRRLVLTNLWRIFIDTKTSYLIPAAMAGFFAKVVKPGLDNK